MERKRTKVIIDIKNDVREIKKQIQELMYELRQANHQTSSSSQGRLSCKSSSKLKDFPKETLEEVLELEALLRSHDNNKLMLVSTASS